MRQCNISLPDGSCSSVPLRAGVTIRDLLTGLCEKLCINLAAVDLFLIGGEKVRHHMCRGGEPVQRLIKGNFKVNECKHVQHLQLPC